jgi:antitoxin PrlF
MREFTATVTSKGQLTLPVEVRRRLGIEPGDKVAIALDGENGARLRRIKYDIDSVRGMFPTPSWMVGRDLDEMIEEATLAHADEVVRRMRDGLE